MLLNLNTIDKVKRFSNIVLTYESDIDAIRGRYIIDAKSIIGLFTIDLSKPVEIKIHSQDAEELERFENDMKPFCMKESRNESILPCR